MRLLNGLAQDFSRRALLVGGAAVFVSGCHRGGADAGPAAASSQAGHSADTIAAAVAGSWRTPQDKARDRWRHPVESLAFWGVKPGATVVEVWPGAGWYADILAPFLAATGGTLYEAEFTPDTPAAGAVRQTFEHRIQANPKLYGQVRLTAFGPGPASGPIAPAGSADVVLFLRNVHDWMRGGIADKAFHDAFLALKPGGVLGIEAHRAPPGGSQDVLATNGYVQEAYVKQMAKDAGFVFDRASEINANPKDNHNHPFGVWTLPPTRRSAPAGKPANPAFNHAPFDAIGESDRMTLRFVKPR
jgi:predicted methyltransferase